MHVRFSTAVGLPVCEEGSHEPLGRIVKILIHPDTGKIEGFGVKISGFLFTSAEKFLPVADILRWSLRVVVRSSDVLCDVTDMVRLEPLLSSPRPVLGQKIVTNNGRQLGRCGDVQFDTTHFMLEWIFPKKLWKAGVPISAGHIEEVRSDAIIIRELLGKVPATAETSTVGSLLNKPEAA